jgi:hypothetical protein
MEADRLASIVGESALLGEILRRWDEVGLPDGWLVAGAIAQTVWNGLFGLPADHGIADIDLIYFDAADLSQETEASHAARIAAAFRHLPVRMDVKNEARVHLWYEARFGYPIEPYRSASGAIATFPTTATALGIRPGGEGLELCAPFGLADLLGGVVRPNKAQITRDIYAAKVTRWLTCWPGLTVVDWDADGPAPVRPSPPAVLPPGPPARCRPT